MFEGFRIFLIIVVLSTANGASISQSVPSTTTNEQNLMGANAVVSSKLWNDVSTRLHLGWEQFKWAAGAVSNKTFQAIDDLVISSNKLQSDPPPEFILITEKTQNDPVTPPTIQVYQEKDLGFTKKVILETNSTTTVISEERRDECDNETSCFTWKLLKIVGSAIGIGFLIGLISPVMFYFTIITIGCCCYGVTFISLAVACNADKGRKIGEQYFTASQHIGASALQNMFSLVPIVLTWLGSACLVGWLMWPVF